jgi:hypothetical protein
MMSPSSRPAAATDVPSEAAATLPVGPARLAIEGRLIPGRVLNPDTQVGFVAFVPDDRELSAPDEGQEVRLDVGTTDHWAASSVVVDVDGPHWFLSLPKGLAPIHRRTASRQPANGDWEFIADEADEAGDPVDAEVHDISADGLGLLVSPSAPMGSSGRRLAGRLQHIDGLGFPVEVEIRNVRRHAHSPDWKVLGCALHLAGGDREKLAMMLAEDA